MADELHTWNTVRAFMQRTCGVVLADDQHYLLEARLGPVARQNKFVSIEQYVQAACAGGVLGPVALTLIDAMTTHETLFFRDPGFWKVFEEQILPPFIKSGKPLRIWSAACSHGQEPYSIAMLLEERWPEVAKTAQIYATDVSLHAIERAKLGVYSSFEINRGLGAARMVRHFEQHEGGYRIKPLLRERISWDSLNLLGARKPARASFDVAMCRNVLIYFSEQDRKAVLSGLFEATVQGGFVGLGATEQCSGNRVSAGWYVNGAVRS